MSKRTIANFTLVGIGVLMGVAIGPLSSLSTSAQGTCQTFPETGKQVCGRFLDYWKNSGGLAQQGLPLSNEFTEVSDLNGQPYTVQYFERAVFEKHPENQAPYDVLLSQLGTFRWKAKYPNGEPGGTTPPAATAVPQPPAGGIVGQKLTLKDLGGTKNAFNVEVLAVDEATTIPEFSPWKGGTAQGKFVIVTLNATNIASDPNTLFSAMVRLKDNKGRTFSASTDTNANLAAAKSRGAEIPGSSVQPSFTSKFVIVYDVATDATGYMLVAR